MRLIDKIASMGKPELREALRKKVPIVFAIDEIAAHYYQNEQMQWESKDYPYARPPWDLCFIEFNQPSWTLQNDGRHETDPSSQVGAVVIFSDKDGCVANTQQLISAKTGQEAPVDPEAACIVMFNHFAFADGRLKDLEILTFWFMKPDGWITNVAHFGPGLDLLAAAGASASDAQGAFDSVTHIFALAFTFANCGNVKLEDVTEALQPPAKIMRRLKLPAFRRYTLNIDGHVFRPRRDSSDPLREGVMPFHLCRGHFATYTAERPLFGKYVGKFWIKPHTRGREERGKIEKSYEVGPSEVAN